MSLDVDLEDNPTTVQMFVALNFDCIVANTTGVSQALTYRGAPTSVQSGELVASARVRS